MNHAATSATPMTVKINSTRFPLSKSENGLFRPGGRQSFSRVRKIYQFLQL